MSVVAVLPRLRWREGLKHVESRRPWVASPPIFIGHLLHTSRLMIPNLLIVWRPQGDSNPCYRRERAMSWASRRWGRRWAPAGAQRPLGAPTPRRAGRGRLHGSRLGDNVRGGRPAETARHGPDRPRSPDEIREAECWWSQAGSNRRPLACHASALPAELWPHAKPPHATQPTVRCQVWPDGDFVNTASRRASVRSRPSNARVASIGGDTAVPVTATRTGCAILPSPLFSRVASSLSAA